MKVVQFLDKSDETSVGAIATSIWSVQRNGNLPTTTEYILYTTDEKNKDSILLKELYDRIEAPPMTSSDLDGSDIEGFVPGSGSDEYGKIYRTQHVFWNKMLSFLKTPCDGDAVLALDWDALCLRNISGCIPGRPKVFACCRYGEYNLGGGFLVKNPKFDEDNIADIIMEPLYDREKYEKAYKLHVSGDEVGLTWYLLNHGTSAISQLAYSYGYSAYYAIRNNIDIAGAGVRILHYGYKSKPWQGYVDNDHPNVKIWWDTRAQMFKELGLEDVSNVKLSD